MDHGQPPADDPDTGRWRSWAAVRYTVLRLGILAVCWIVVQFVTGLRGLLAAAIAVVLSGAISLLLLSRQRDAYSTRVFGTLRRINDRIDAAARAEDEPDEPDEPDRPAGEDPDDAAKGA